MYLQAAINISFQVVLTFVLSCIAKVHICFQVVLVRFTFVFKLLFTSCYTLSCIYKLLQCTSSSCITTFGNDVGRHNATAKTGSKVSLYTTSVIAVIILI